MKKAVTFLLLISSFSIYAQDTVKVSLQELRQKPLDQNLQLILAQKEIELTEAELLKTRAISRKRSY